MSTASDSRTSLPHHIVVQHKTSLLGRIFAWAGWAGFLFCALSLIGIRVTLSDYFDTTEGITEKYHSKSKTPFGVDKVAIIEVSGVIIEGDGHVKRQIDYVREDQAVKAVVLRVDTPGGTVTGSDYIYHHLNELRQDRNLPVVVSMGSMATSGGYYVSMAVGDQEKSIYAEPTTVTGSIGVIMPHYDLSGLLARFDVKDDSIASHPRKQMLSMTRPVPEEHREIIQGQINEMFERFKGIVKEGRPKFQKDEAALTEIATGEVFSAPKAQELGLIDEIGFIEKAIDRAIELARLDENNVRVVKYPAPVSLFDLGSLTQAKQQSFDAATLLDLSVPRAWYLSTTLPGLASSRRAD